MGARTSGATYPWAEYDPTGPGKLPVDTYGALRHRFTIDTTSFQAPDGAWWVRVSLGALCHTHWLQVPKTNRSRLWRCLREGTVIAYGGEVDTAGETIEVGHYKIVDITWGAPGSLAVTIAEVESMYSAGARWAAGGPVLEERPETTPERVARQLRMRLSLMSEAQTHEAQQLARELKRVGRATQLSAGEVERLRQQVLRLAEGGGELPDETPGA